MATNHVDSIMSMTTPLDEIVLSDENLSLSTENINNEIDFHSANLHCVAKEIFDLGQFICQLGDQIQASQSDLHIDALFEHSGWIYLYQTEYDYGGEALAIYREGLQVIRLYNEYTEDGHPVAVHVSQGREAVYSFDWRIPGITKQENLDKSILSLHEIILVLRKAVESLSQQVPLEKEMRMHRDTK